jgi:hypothetical protein
MAENESEKTAAKYQPKKLKMAKAAIMAGE